MFSSKLLSLLLVCLLAGCENFVSKDPNANQTAPAQKKQLTLKMERTGCYGTCPIYVLSVAVDGKVLFEGKEFTKTLGRAESRLDEEKVKQLIDEIEKADFFSLKEYYQRVSDGCANEVTDMPTVILTIQLNERSKSIRHYLGCLEKDIFKEGGKIKVFPQNLYNLENKIDEIAETRRWIGEKK